MSSKVDRAIHGPSWTEVILGAVLSLILGVVLGAVLLILKPVDKVNEPPKEPATGVVYYIQGSQAGSRDRALAKQKAFVDGQSVQVTEDDLNSLMLSLAAGTAPGGKKPAPAGTEMLSPGTPNFRIQHGVLQVGLPMVLNVAGLTEPIIVQARGGFEKKGGVFVYEPSELYLGSCPVQRLPFVGSYLRSKALETHPVPADVAAAWKKLSSVSIDGNTLALSQ
ncbi:MAG TPA: hypothetical protein VHE61_09240 [Opitutaceae bacterium]|nr:hypothetical protein [Opitutaceae bacterium]